MTLILANKCTCWQVYSTLIYMMKCQISMISMALMYMQHKHIVYGELHILPYLVLYQNKNDNAYSTLLRHEVWDVNQKIIIQGIYLCYNTFHVFEFNSSIILNMILSFCQFSFHESFLFSLTNGTILEVLFFHMIFEFLR